MSVSALEIEGLVFVAGGRRILDSVDLEVEKGRRLFIIGPNGAGKSSLLRCIMRIVPMDSGRIRVGGMDISGISQKTLASMAGFVPQQSASACPFTAGEYVLLARYPHLSPFSRISRSDLAEARSAMAVTGTEGLAERSYSTLSGGERQMVDIAAVLAQGADLILLDEPSAFLDPLHSREVNGLIERIRTERGATVVSVTHDINEALLGEGEMALLKEGRVIFRGDPPEAVESGMLEELYGREFEYSTHPSTGRRFVLPDAGGRR